jgi:hypothetical protein
MAIYYFDIDNTLCSTINGDYKSAQPYYDRIKKVNELYNKGNDIVITTSRGFITGINWELLTKKQLSRWGVKYHNLLFNKPYFDYFIDDKAIRADTFFKGVSSNECRYNPRRTYKWDKESW